MKIPSLEWNQRTWPRGLSRFKSSRRLPYYGAEWGSPDDSTFKYLIQRYILQKNIPGNLRKVVEGYITPYVRSSQRVVEIGSGGGRWTKYLLNVKELLVVELNVEFIDHLKERFCAFSNKMKFYQTSGFEMRGIDENRYNFLFTFGTFVHIEPEGILEYLKEIKRILKPGALAVIQYADKKKKQAKTIMSFSKMDSVRMEAFVEQEGLVSIEHNTRILNHSNIILLKKPE